MPSFKTSLGFALLLVSSPTLAAQQVLSDQEKQLIQSFDAAVRAPDPLKAISDLSWAPGARIYLPQYLGRLKACKLGYMYKYRKTLIGSWGEAASPSQPCLDSGSGGYFVHLKVKNGRIEMASLSEAQIIVTSGQR
jgi:hypothetical protein